MRGHYKLWDFQYEQVEADLLLFVLLGYDNLAEAGKKKKDRQKMPFEVGHGLRDEFSAQPLSKINLTTCTVPILIILKDFTREITSWSEK